MSGDAIIRAAPFPSEIEEVHFEAIGVAATRGKAGYFKVSMDAAIAIARASNSAELLASYIVLCRHACDGRGRSKGKRDCTAAGAKAIRKTLGLTDYRSKRVLRQLRCERLGADGSSTLFEPAGFVIRNADAYLIKPLGERFAYLPSIFCDRVGGDASPISKLLDSGSADPLLLLLYAYETVVYGDWFGCPPDALVHQTWRDSGDAGVGWFGLELGHQGRDAGVDVWLAGEPRDATWRVSQAAGELFENDAKRVVSAVEILLDREALVRVAYCQGQPSYPLWVFNSGYRKSLATLGIDGELAKLAQRAAYSLRIDAADFLAMEANTQAETKGTGLFFFVGGSPTVYTLVAPRLHAPTPRNMDELEEARRVTQGIAKALEAF